MKYLILSVALVLGGCVDHSFDRAKTAVEAGGAQAMKETCLRSAEDRWRMTKDTAEAILVDLKKCEAAADAVYTAHPEEKK